MATNLRSGDLFARALAALDAGRGVALAAVTGARGSTPRHIGARMAIADDGEQWGTVGGGKIEQLVVAAALEVARGGQPVAIRRHLIRDLAMCCGGSMDVAITPAAASREVLVALAAVGRNDSRVLETPLDGGPLALRGAAAGDPRLHAPVIAGGRMVERIGYPERAILFGLGHVARALGPLLDNLGFAVIACDDDETGALAADGPPAWAARVLETFDAAEVERAVGGFGADDHVLIVTRDHAIDQKLLEYLLTRDTIGYLGMIGSRGKVGRFYKRFLARGLVGDPVGEARWARLSAPIGLDLGAETPEEIAVAIAAELVARRRRGGATIGDWTARKASDV